MAPPAPGDDPQLVLARRSWRPDRVPRLPLFVRSDGESPAARAGLMLKLTEGTRAPYDVVVHGSAEEDDRRVPVLLLGPGVEPDLGSDRARLVDVAPTLARVGGVPVPDGLDGRVLDGVSSSGAAGGSSIP